MNADLTIDTLSFKLAYNDKDGGSVRREVSRGPNLPEILTVKHSDVIDSATKLPSSRDLLREDYYVALSSGVIAPVSAYVVVQAPKDSNVTSAVLLAALQRIISVLSTEATTGLNLKSEIFVSRLQ